MGFPDVHAKDFTSDEVSGLIKQWAKDNPLLESQTPANDVNNQTQQETAISGTRVLSNRKRTRLKKEEKMNKLRQKNDNITNAMALTSSGPSHYVDYNLNEGSDSNNDDFECMMLKTTPTVPICLYEDKVDVYVSKTIRSTGLWEGHIMERFQDFLARDRSLGVIDVGANLGQYSLVAAAMGHTVLAVEPWEESLRRMRRAIKMAALQSKIRVLKNIISDLRQRRCLHAGGDNQGNVRVVNPPQENTPGGTAGFDSGNRAQNDKCRHRAHSLFLNDLVANVTFTKALLKLDIQGQEHRAFLHAEALLDAIFVPHIFMEWVIMRAFWVTPYHESLDKAIVRRMVARLTGRGYRVFSMVSGKELDIRYWYGWPEDVLWTHSSVIH